MEQLTAAYADDGQVALANGEPGGGEGESLPGSEVAEWGAMMSWARQRLELYERINRVTRDAVAALLDTAAEMRGDIETDAATLQDRLRRESGEIAVRTSALQAEQARLLQEVAELRGDSAAALDERRAEAAAELERIRREAAYQVRQVREGFEHSVRQLRGDGHAEMERTVRDARARRADIDAEVQALQEQMGEIQQVLDGFLDSQRRTLMGPATAPSGRTVAPAVQNGHAKGA